jgi:hypothetical protein
MNAVRRLERQQQRACELAQSAALGAQRRGEQVGPLGQLARLKMTF